VILTESSLLFCALGKLTVFINYSKREREREISSPKENYNWKVKTKNKVSMKKFKIV
jgi:hypothetical protein